MLNVQTNISNFLFLTEVGEANYLHLLFSFIPLVNRSFIHHVLDTCIVPGPVGSHRLYNITNHEVGAGGGGQKHMLVKDFISSKTTSHHVHCRIPAIFFQVTSLVLIIYREVVVFSSLRV